MEINADFDGVALVHSEDLDWVASPMPGVERRMLDRIGGEVARATSIVRYAPGSAFSPHVHDGGEEFLVLDGVFQDEHGDFPAGTYVRNPPTSRHRPGSEAGCTIFVKLWQMDPDDRTAVRLDIGEALAAAPAGGAAELFRDAREVVTARRLAAGEELSLSEPGGTEILVLGGALATSAGGLRRGSWLRLPAGAPLRATAGEAGATLWMKTGHLPFARAPRA